LDFVQARYYSSVQGRFTSVDPYSLILDKQAAGRTSAAESEFTSWISDPRRWNKYAFALNNPLRYVDQDGEDPIEALEKAVQQLARFRDLAGSMIRSGKANIAAEATRLALEAVFGKQIAVTAGGLSGAEVELAKEVSAFEGKSFLGVRNSSQEGIDGILFDGYAPTNTNSFQPVQLQENSTGGELRILNDSTRHANQIDKAGMNNISLFVKSTDKSVTVGSLLTFIKNGGNGGLVGTSNRSAIKNVTIFAQDGVVRIEKGKVYSCDSNNKCQSR
jgi:RHS repeat-associated protein